MLLGAALLVGSVAIEFPLAAQASSAQAAQAASARVAQAASSAQAPRTVSGAPVVYAVDPNSGTTLGGTTVTIYGAGFTSASTVKFGTVSTGCGRFGGFFVISDTQIFVISPAGALGTVDVVVVGPGGSSPTGVQDRFTYVNPSVAVVNGISPNSGPTAGGTIVTLNGSGFTNATRVLFGTTVVFGFASSDSLLQVSSPLGAAGTVDVTVLNPSGTSAITNADKFTFTPPGTPVVRAIAPNSSTAAGGIRAFIFGSGFSAASAVHFGAITLGAGAFNVVDDNQIFVTAPPGTASTTVDVTITTPTGTSVATNADKFSYLAPTLPVVNAVLINQGPSGGGTGLNLFGSGFSGATAVKFGTNTATGLTIIDDRNLFVTSPPGAVGTVHITVTTPVGTSVASSADQFTYVTTPVPVVYGIAPNRGTTAGRTIVTIFGTGFTGATAVMFGTTAARINFVGGGTQIFVTSPAGVAGMVDVTVTNPSGTSTANAGDKYTYVAPGLPVVNSVAPNQGAPAGGDSVELLGSGFTGATSVKFGTVAGTNVFGFTDTQLSVTSPPGTNGTTVDVTVTTAVGTSALSLADRFAYVTPPAPAVTAISPSSGPTTGGTAVWISGSGLTGAFSIKFGTTFASGRQVVSDNVIQVFGSPAGTGTVDVTVTTAGGTSAITTADHFTYTAPPPPVVVAVGPSTGPASGGSKVYISGSGFSGASVVNFGATPAGFFVSFDGNLITATSPAGAMGTVNITVVGPGGTSPITANDQFTYTASSPPPAPVVTAVSPSSGSAAGGSTVYITGANFTRVSRVNFGINPAGFFVSSDNLITVTSTPGGTPGFVDVTVVTPSGTSIATSNDHYTYVAPVAPTVTGVSPGTGPLLSGTTVWITGTGLTAASAVSFGTTAAAGFGVVSDNLIDAISPAGSGTVHITVTTAGGVSATSANDQFIYGGPPPSGLQVNGVSPNHGPAAGGTNVVIEGMGFTGATGVMFGTTAAQINFVGGDTQIFVTSPAGTAGTVDVTVTVVASTSAVTKADLFTSTAPVQPVVNAVDPNHGSSGGGTSVTIFGSGFSGATTVQFGSSAPISGFPFGGTQITVMSPVGPAGTSVDVTVTSSGGTSATSSADTFTYVAPGPPVVNAVDPNSGTTLGGTSVTIFGSGFSGTSTVLFGSTSTIKEFGSDTQLNVFSPAAALGTVDVTVNTPGGTSATSNADKFTYVAPGIPVVNAISPNQGGTAGGRTVRIFGAGLSAASAASFGTAAATQIFQVSDSEVDVTSPPGAVGTVHVRVTTPGGISVAGAADQYTYFVAPAPTITVVSPNSGAAGTQVFITGTGLSDATSVLFGGCVLRFSTFFGGDTSLQVFAPAGPTGTVDVTVITPEGTSAITVNDRFTYSTPPLPTVTYVAPASGPSGGGTTVFITGTGLSGLTSVMFGSAPATQSSGPLFAIDDNLIEATSPAGTNGATVDIRVTTPGGTSAAGSADHFTYGPTPAPAVSAVSPNSGPSGGGSDVFVTGSGFLAATQMNFGTAVLTPCFFFGRGRGGSSPTSSAPSVPSVQLPTATRLPIHDPTRSARTDAPRFATVLVPSVAHRLLTGLAPQPAAKSRPAPLRGFFPQPCTGFVAFTDNLIRLVSPPGAVGTVDITVTGPGGTSATGATDHYTYVATPAPVVSAVSPNGGPSGGGTTVFVSGSNLRNASAVQFGGVTASIQSDPFLFSFFFFGAKVDSLIEVLSPAGTNPSTVDVTVTTAGGTSATSAADLFTYGPTPTPSVSAVSPNSGPIGTTVFITGAGFLGATAVDFGTVPAIGLPGFSVISDTLIQATSPSNSLGTVHVTVVTAGGTSTASAADQYTYTASPTPAVTAVSPNQGVAGTVVYVTGSGLTAASAVSFGATGATFVFFSDTLIQATSPAGSGTVDVRVTTPGGISATIAADLYTYGVAPPGPTVSSVVPNSGPSTGGTSVTITGTNFTGATAVKFGTVAATTFTVNSSTQITATSPAGSSIVDVTVTTAGGTSATSGADKFTYVRPPRPAAQSSPAPTPTPRPTAQSSPVPTPPGR